MMIHKHVSLAAQLGYLLQSHGLLLAVAESCTGGGLAATLTSIPGSSAWFDRGFITYSNHAKQDMLDVPESTLLLDGAVSEIPARAMAEGCFHHSAADLSVAITGIAGPDGGSPTKPVGTVWIACAGARQKTTARYYYFKGNREDVRQAAEHEALNMLISRVRHSLPKINTQAPTYFFALMPDHATAQTLDQRARVFTEQVSSKPIPPEKLHLTLAYLGRLHPTELNNLKNIASPCPIPPFELCIKEVKYWPEQKLTYLAPELPSKPLEHLHMFLNQHLLQQGFKPERHVFVPHITIARHDNQIFKTPHSIQPLPWFVHTLCLVQSQLRTAPMSSHYTIIQRWPLKLI